MSTIVMSRWVPMNAREEPAVGQGALVTDGLQVIPGRFGPDLQWYRDAPGNPRLMENYLFGPPETWYWMKLPEPPGVA